ncbi:exosortase-associated protein EpsI, B-type [Noviherbaspirillum aridicola]|uniref:Methanolan biosynthesis EpsI domain-containing protein n=1 Tax=Noviherbaspirillum aridicola TaxID=2849687 RepID=A0ABQ4Q696_9BURK|nr:exosortase-associated protein EpsI, B-type [Noviherbaspirillum aridicola]GIZ52507.1 hypothetical protein NCCP691_25210 [Noviherbaspirillum aridicola]
MRVSLLRNLVIMAVMFFAAAAAVGLKPTRHVADEVGRVDYEQVVPRRFGSWSMVEADVITVSDPGQQEFLDRIYSQVVTRSYRDAVTGQVVMLAIAYGEEQTKQSQVHLPEICYPAQGFQLLRRAKDNIASGAQSLPVMRILTQRQTRLEPVTYWVRIGERVVRGGIEQKLATVTDGLGGRISDGLLFRVSSVSASAEDGYRLQDRFVTDLLSSVPARERWLLVGGQDAGGTMRQ